MERKQFRDHIEVIMYYIVKRKQISEAKRVCREYSRQIIFCIYEKKGQNDLADSEIMLTFAAELSRGAHRCGLR